MKTLKIELVNDYYIEVDDLNHTLKQRYTGKDRDGARKECERTIGYFPDVQACVKRLFRLIALDETDKTVISLREYAECIEKAFLKIKDREAEELKRWHTCAINPKIKNPFAATFTSICANCHHKDEYIEELEDELGKK